MTVYVILTFLTSIPCGVFSSHGVCYDVHVYDGVFHLSSLRVRMFLLIYCIKFEVLEAHRQLKSKKILGLKLRMPITKPIYPLCHFEISPYF